MLSDSVSYAHFTKEIGPKLIAALRAERQKNVVLRRIIAEADTERCNRRPCTCGRHRDWT